MTHDDAGGLGSGTGLTQVSELELWGNSAAFRDTGAGHLFRNAAATITELADALLPMERGAEEADYYCPDDVPDDHVVLVRVTVGELRAARAVLAKLEAER